LQRGGSRNRGSSLRLREFHFLADENVHPEVVAYLRTHGFDVLDVKEAGMTGAGDLALIRAATAADRVVLTHDRDFGTLAIAAGEPTAGIVYLRPGHIRAGFTIRTLAALLARELDLAVPFLIVAEGGAGAVRIRVREL